MHTARICWIPNSRYEDRYCAISLDASDLICLFLDVIHCNSRYEDSRYEADLLQYVLLNWDQRRHR